MTSSQQTPFSKPSLHPAPRGWRIQHRRSIPSSPVTAGPRRGLMRIVCGGFLFVVAVLLSPVVGAGAALATAVLTAQLPLLIATAVVVLLSTGYGLARAGGWLLMLPRPQLTAALTAGVTAAVVCALAALTVFSPTQSPSADRGDPRGPGHIWTLSTGSKIAYDHVVARGAAWPTPVILLHGGPGTPGSGPGALGAALSREGFDVYAYDQVGSGRSQRLADPGQYTVARQIADLEAVRHQIGAQQMVIVGTSWGATLAAEYLAAYPERVARVIFVSPGAIWEPAWDESAKGEVWDRVPADRRQPFEDLTSGSRLTAWSLLAAVNPRAAHQLIGDREIDALFTDLLKIVGSAGSCQSNRNLGYPGGVPGFYVNQFVSADQQTRPDPRPRLRHVDVPALVLRGECDYIRSQIAQEYAQILPGAVLREIPSAGHLIRFDQPDVFQQAVVAFISDAR